MDKRCPSTLKLPWNGICTCLVVTGCLVKDEEDVSEEVVVGRGQAVHKAGEGGDW